MTRLSRDALSTVSKVGEAYRQQVADGQEAAHHWAEDTKAGMESLVTARERGVRLLRDLATESNKEVENSQKRATDIAGRMDDVRFAYHMTQVHNTLEQEAEYAERAGSLAFEANKAMEAAKTPKDESAAHDIFKRAEAAAQEASRRCKAVRQHLGAVRG